MSIVTASTVPNTAAGGTTEISVMAPQFSARLVASAGAVVVPGLPSAEPVVRNLGDYLVLGLAVLLLTLLLGVAVRRPRILDEWGRPTAVSLLTAMVVFAWYFLALPYIARPFWALLKQNQPADFAASTAGNATMQWLVHGLSVPVLFLWWWGRERDRQRPPLPGDFLFCPDLHRQTESGCANRAARGWLASIVVALPVFVAAFLVVILTNYTAASIKQWYTGVAPEILAHQTLVLLRENDFDPWTLLIILSVTLAAPIIEEFVYRGTLQAYLRNLSGSALVAVIVSAVIFASMHVGVANLEALPGLFMLAIFMGSAYAFSGRLITPILIHLLFNLTNIVLLYWLNDGPKPQ